MFKYNVNIYLEYKYNIFIIVSSESIFVGAARFEFRVMTLGDQQRQLSYRLNVNLKKEINMTNNPLTIYIYYKEILK